MTDLHVMQLPHLQRIMAAVAVECSLVLEAWLLKVLPVFTESQNPEVMSTF
jgi:hypothetical protein